jgi:glycosyltransferase involved in cell wall biosynthesis
VDLTVITAARRPDPALFAECADSLCDAAAGLSLQWVVVLDDSTSRTDVQRSLTHASERGLRVDVLERPFRAGAGGARSIGLTRCVSEWVTVLDADDLLPIDALHFQLEALQSHPTAQWCVGAGETLDGSRTLHPHSLPPVVPAGLIAAHTRDTGSMPTIPIAGVWRTNEVLRLGAWPALPRDEDTSLKLALTSVAPGVSVPQSVYVYRRGVPNQATATPVFKLSAKLCRQAALDRLTALAAHGEAPNHVVEGDWSTFLNG